MKYTFKEGKKSTVEITIDLTEKEWNEAINSAYEKDKGRYSMPGFRKGKVPKHLLEQTYGKGIFYEEAINIAFPKYYTEVLEKETSIEAVASPEIDIKNISDKGITMIAIVAVKPEVTLGEYKGITFEKVEYNVKEADIKADLDRLQEMNSRLVDVTDRAVEKGDTTIIDYSGSVDGVKFDGGTAEKQELVIGSNSFIPGFEDQIIGMKIGEERDIKVKFPEEYHAENLKGKDSVFHIKLHEIKKKELPEINDEFIKDAVGAESLDAYKAEVKARLQKQNDERADRELEDAIVKKISENAKVEIPDALIDNQVEQMIQDMSYRLMYQGLKLEDYLKYIGQSMDDFKNGYKPKAEELVKSQLVIDKILKDEKIEATEEDVNAKLEEIAKEQDKKVEDIKKEYKDRGMSYIKNEIIIKKLFDFLKAENKVVKAKKAAAKTEDKAEEKPAAKKTTAKKTTAKKED